MRVALTAAAAALLLVAGAACGERAEPTGASVPMGTVTVRGAGDETTVLHAPPQRIAAVGDTPTRILRGLGVGKYVVGHNLDLVTGPALVAEIRRLHPDLIVGSSESDPADLDRAGRDTRAPVYVAPDSSVRQVERAIDDLGLLTGTAARARGLVAGIQASQALVAKKLAHAKPVRVFVDTGYFNTVGYRSLFGDIVKEAGGANVAGADPEAGAFSFKLLAKRKPQVYLAQSDSGTTLRALRKNPRTRLLPAVKKRRFAIVPLKLVQAGPDVGAGVTAVARLLHPEAFR